MAVGWDGMGWHGMGIEYIYRIVSRSKRAKSVVFGKQEEPLHYVAEAANPNPGNKTGVVYMVA